MPVDDLIPFLKKNVPLFREFFEEQLQQLAAGARTTVYQPSESIIEFGEEGRFMGVLLEGEASVSHVDDGGEMQTVARLGMGDIFGEMSLMTGDRTTADVIATSRCRALLIPQAIFSTAIIGNPVAVRYLARILSERTRDLSAQKANRLAAAAMAQAQDPYGFRLRSEYPHRILVVNCGSSSLKFQLFDTADETAGARGEVKLTPGSGSFHEAFAAMAATLTDPKTGAISSLADVTLVGHRVVHGGARFQEAVLVTDEILQAIDDLASLAPLHNPLNAAGIRAAKALFPAAPHMAVFDTAFHHTLPPYAYLYGLPYEYYSKKNIRRYGFHGSSHAYVALKAAEFLRRPFNEMEIITCHLGNGASMCAVDHGRSVDTSMGMTPTEGLLMGTRCGDLDPAILVHLMRTEGFDAVGLDRLINQESGLLGLSGLSHDMREIEAAAEAGHDRALLAHRVFCYRVRKSIGAYAAAMGGLDTIIFTGGIGQGSAGTRHLACQGLGFMGIHLDETRNREARGFDQICRISPDGAPVEVLVVPTDEERMIAREALRVLDRSHISDIIHNRQRAPIPVEVSAHHVHLAQAEVEALFGPGHQLTREFDLSQPGQFACRETVNLIGSRGRVDKVRVLGPARRETQVEISMTEQFKLGIHPPIRQSGDLDGSPGLTLEGTAGQAALAKGVICAMRHIHMSPEDAMNYGLRDRYVVRVRVEGGDRDLVYGDVLVRVHPDFRLAMHLDTDEANASAIKTGARGYIEEIQSRG